MNASKAQDWLRLLFAQIDKMIYWLISVTYSIIMQLKDISIFGEGDIKEFSGRIYAFLGIIMLFKVTFSLITYLVDPDASKDKARGTGNLIKNILITLVLIVLVPYGFDLLYSAQAAIIDDNLIPRLILGTKEEANNLTLIMDSDACDGKAAQVANYGDYLALATLRPFVHVYEDSDISKADLIGKLDDSVRDIYCYSGKTGTVLSKSVLYADTAILNTGEYIFEYNYFISTAFGVLMFLLLLNFCFDIAVRTIKLGFLEIMAPIPIISYVDPKSGKDGQFKKWLKEVFNTWLSLFLRLGAVYFAIYIITMINNNVEQIHQENGNVVMLFLIIGALMFAKQVVPLIENIFGIKLNHTVQLNPFKKISDQALGGKMVASLPSKALSATVGGAVAAGGLIYANRKRKEELMKKSNEYNAARSRLTESMLDNERAVTNYNNLKNNRLKQAEQLKQQSIDFYNKQEEWNPENAKQYLDLKNKAEQMEVTPTQAEINAQEKIETTNSRVEVEKANMEVKEGALEETSKNNDVFSYNHQIMATMLQALRGARLGFDTKAVENIAKAVSDGVNAATKATKIRNDYDKFGFFDRLKDLGTDVTGIKNESGTTSALKAALKEQNENLNNIRNAISSLEHSFGNLKPGAISYDKNGKMTLNVSGTYQYAVGEKESIQSLINQYETLRQSEKATTKQIKEFEEVLAINKPPKK